MKNHFSSVLLVTSKSQSHLDLRGGEIKSASLWECGNSHERHVKLEYFYGHLWKIKSMTVGQAWLEFLNITCRSCIIFAQVTSPFLSKSLKKSFPYISIMTKPTIWLEFKKSANINTINISLFYFVCFCMCHSLLFVSLSFKYLSWYPWTQSSVSFCRNSFLLNIIAVLSQAIRKKKRTKCFSNYILDL